MVMVVVVGRGCLKLKVCTGIDCALAKQSVGAGKREGVGRWVIERRHHKQVSENMINGLLGVSIQGF